ncbi:Os04g0341933 [Oryza sativa Japonica Group]|uniref:Os04g0341933 protein n=1 Tax=Oryza sativa subsp. japonica TaxID=39947 RepID=A0A0P0W8Q1_ORYSJ|nr:hypothetical protein DAI22_04g082901 [Oryza sativa Japonica Group]BAS88669.1 Os04g0341933 [Oryza sativa Japonica Group]
MASGRRRRLPPLLTTGELQILPRARTDGELLPARAPPPHRRCSRSPANSSSSPARGRHASSSPRMDGRRAPPRARTACELLPARGQPASSSPVRRRHRQLPRPSTAPTASSCCARFRKITWCSYAASAGLPLWRSSSRALMADATLSSPAAAAAIWLSKIDLVQANHEQYGRHHRDRSDLAS